MEILGLICGQRGDTGLDNVSDIRTVMDDRDDWRERGLVELVLRPGEVSEEKDIWGGRKGGREGGTELHLRAFLFLCPLLLLSLLKAWPVFRASIRPSNTPKECITMIIWTDKMISMDLQLSLIEFFIVTEANIYINSIFPLFCFIRHLLLVLLNNVRDI